MLCNLKMESKRLMSKYWMSNNISLLSLKTYME
jgi:hypothetical protein